MKSMDLGASGRYSRVKSTPQTSRVAPAAPNTTRIHETSRTSSSYASIHTPGAHIHSLNCDIFICPIAEKWLYFNGLIGDCGCLAYVRGPHIHTLGLRRRQQFYQICA